MAKPPPILRAEIGFAWAFRGLEALLFAPVAAIVGGWLTGREVIDSTAIAGFLASPRGLFALLLGAGLLLAVRLAEHAGLVAIHLSGGRLAPLAAFRLVAARLHLLWRLGVLLAGGALAAAAPLLATGGVAAALLLGRHDINWYLAARPLEAWAAAIAILLAALLSLGLLLALVARWRLAVPAMLAERLTPRAALARSVDLTRGHRAAIARQVLALVAAGIGAALAASALGGLVVRGVLALLPGQLVTEGWPGRAAGLLLATGLAVRIGIGLVATLAVTITDARLFADWYRRLGPPLASGALRLPGSGAQLTRGLRWVAPAFVGGLMLAGLVGTRAALDALERQGVVSVQAHRGLVGPEVPENSLAAFRAALAAGADTVETDVQLTRDGVPVLVHDRDLMRLARQPLRIATTDWATLAAVPLAGGQRLARLEELLELARATGLRVNLELKHYPGDDRDRLARVAVASIRAAGLVDQVGIQSLELAPLRTVQREAPELAVGYLLSLNARDPWALRVNWLAVEQRRISPALVRQAHRRGVRVLAWTVNDEAEMVRLVNLGVDGLITDRPDVARSVVERSVQAAAGRELARLRALLDG